MRMLSRNFFRFFSIETFVGATKELNFGLLVEIIASVRRETAATFAGAKIQSLYFVSIGCSFIKPVNLMSFIFCPKLIRRVRRADPILYTCEPRKARQIESQNGSRALLSSLRRRRRGTIGKIQRKCAT